MEAKKLAPNEKLDIENILKDLDKYRPKGAGLGELRSPA